MSNEDNRQYWEGVMNRWQASGLNGNEFCRKEGVKNSTFAGWKLKILGKNHTKVSSDEDTDRFVPVGESSQIIIKINERIRVELPLKVEASVLKSIIEALKDA